MSEELYLCVHATEFPAQTLVRLRPELPPEPVAVLEGRPPLEAICALNRQARQKGAAWGMTRLEAEGIAGLRLMTRSIESEEASEHKPRPLRRMTTDERLTADFSGTGITTGPHPMAYHRAALQLDGILTAQELEHGNSNQPVRVAGCVIARQRPGTAKGFVFLSIEDETGIANIILAPDIFELNRITVTRSSFLEIDGRLQNQDGVIHVRAHRIWPLDMNSVAVRSHDFH